MLDGDLNVRVGEVLGVQFHQQKGRFKVVWIGEPLTDHAGLIGLAISLMNKISGDFPLPLPPARNPASIQLMDTAHSVTASPNEGSRNSSSKAASAAEKTTIAERTKGSPGQGTAEVRCTSSTVPIYANPCRHRTRRMLSGASLALGLRTLGPSTWQ